MNVASWSDPGRAAVVALIVIDATTTSGIELIGVPSYGLVLDMPTGAFGSMIPAIRGREVVSQCWPWG